MSGAKVVVKPVTRAPLGDFVTLFSSRGCPHYCWCTPYRFREAQHMDKAEKRAAMEGRVRVGTPIGVLAYIGDEPIGWCSVAPRETYVRLERSRTMPRVDDAPTWTVLCLFVRRDHRGEGVTEALLRAAIAYAKKGGAEVIEGYPYDTAGVTSPRPVRALRRGRLPAGGEAMVVGAAGGGGDETATDEGHAKAPDGGAEGPPGWETITRQQSSAIDAQRL